MNPMAILRKAIRYRSAFRMDADSLEAMEKRLLDSLIRSARQTRHYRHVTEFSGIFTTKDDIRKDPHAFIRHGGRAETELRTSGSSGQPLAVLLDRDALESRVASEYAVTTDCGRGPFDLYATLYDKPATIHPLRRLIFPEMSLSLFEDERKILERMRSRGARILSSYPSVIGSLARRNESLGLKMVFTRGEMLTPGLRRLISRSFSCDVLDQYGLNESGLVAFECPEKSMHVNSGFCKVEIIGADGYPAQDGEVVVTCLANHMMPILRYRTGDLAAWGRGCGCGRTLPVIEKIKGREDDMLILPSGKTTSASFIDLLADIPGIAEYQMVQEDADRLVLRFVPGHGFSEKARKSMISVIRKGCRGEKVSIELEEVQLIPRGATGKMATVISKVKQ
jgi:phenylacetate-CoA ligase